MVHRAPLASHIAVLVGATLLAACSGAPFGLPPEPSRTSPYPSLASLKAEAAADLAMPGATLIRNVGLEGFMNITGWEPAFYGHVCGTQRNSDEVFAFYERELVRLGWKPDSPPILSSGELDGWGWCKSGLFYRLAIFDPKNYDRAGISDRGRFAVVYDARLQGTRESCPAARRGDESRVGILSELGRWASIGSG